MRGLLMECSYSNQYGLNILPKLCDTGESDDRQLPFV
jgi:hypothetical protein